MTPEAREPLEGVVIPSVNPLTHSHLWGEWSVWTEVPGTNYRYRMHACVLPSCFTIVMDHEPVDNELDAMLSMDAKASEEHHVGSDAQCNDFLMEDSWEDGFRCTLPDGHKGAHREHTNLNAEMVSTHRDGRAYDWAHEWQYRTENGATPRAAQPQGSQVMSH